MVIRVWLRSLPPPPRGSRDEPRQTMAEGRLPTYQTWHLLRDTCSFWIDSVCGFGRSILLESHWPTGGVLGEGKLTDANTWRGEAEGEADSSRLLTGSRFCWKGDLRYPSLALKPLPQAAPRSKQSRQTPNSQCGNPLSSAYPDPPTYHWPSLNHVFTYFPSRHMQGNLQAALCFFSMQITAPPR